jgi:hypothetical protein
MPLTLLTRDEQPLFERGIAPDLLADVAPLFVDGRNATFTAGQVTPAPGVRLVANPRRRELLTALSSQFAYGSDRIFMAFADGVVEYTLAGGIVVSGTAINAPRITQFAPFGNFTFAANGGNLIGKVADGGTFYPLDTRPQADFVISLSPYLIVFKDRQGAWCASDDPENWDYADPNFDAGQLPIRDMDSDITCVIPWGQDTLVFSNNGIWRWVYIGGFNIFGVEKLRGVKVGAVGRNAVCDAEGMLFGFSQAGIWQSDGNSHRMIDWPQIHDTFYGKMLDPSKIEETVAWHDAANERICFFYQHRDGTRQGLGYSIRNGTWQLLSSGYVVADRFNAWGSALLGSDDGLVWEQTAEVVPISKVSFGGLRTKTELAIAVGFDAMGFDQGPYDGTNITGKPTGSATEADIDISYTTPEGTTFQLSSVRSGVAEEVWVETKWMDLGAPYWKYIDYVIIKITGITKGDFSVQVAVTDEADEYTTTPWEGPFELGTVESPLFFKGQVSKPVGRYLKLRIRDAYVRGRWALTRIDVWGKIVGGRAVRG